MLDEAMNDEMYRRNQPMVETGYNQMAHQGMGRQTGQ